MGLGRRAQRTAKWRLLFGQGLLCDCATVARACFGRGRKQVSFSLRSRPSPQTGCPTTSWRFEMDTGLFIANLAWRAAQKAERTLLIPLLDRSIAPCSAARPRQQGRARLRGGVLAKVFVEAGDVKDVKGRQGVAWRPKSIQPSFVHVVLGES